MLTLAYEDARTGKINVLMFNKYYVPILCLFKFSFSASILTLITINSEANIYTKFPGSAHDRLLTYFT